MLQTIDPIATTIFGLCCTLGGFAFGVLVTRGRAHQRDAATGHQGYASIDVAGGAHSNVETSAPDPIALAALLTVDEMVEEARRRAGDDPVKQVAMGSILSDGVREVRGILAKYYRGQGR